MSNKQEKELEETIVKWVESFNEIMDKQEINSAKQEMFKKGLLIGLNKGLEIGELAGKSGIELKLDFNIKE